jgi:hypothetical protein
MRIMNVVTKLRIRSERGFSHFLVPLIAIVGVAGVGSCLMFITHAATATYEISNGNGICINDPGNQGQTGVNLTAKVCDQTSRQIFALVGTGGVTSYHIYKVYPTSSGPECIGSTGNSTKTGTKLQAVGCSKALTLYQNSCTQLEIAKSGSSSCNGICIDSASGAMILSNCSKAGNWKPRAETAVSSSGGSNSGTGTSSGSGSTAPSGSSTTASAMPTAAPSGFTRAFTEDFNTTAALGKFASVYGGQFGEYDGSTSTNGVTKYDSSKVLSVSNGSLYYNLHSVSGQSYAAAPQAWSGKSFLYGQVGMSVRLDSSTGPGYKIAFLLWPATNKWSNEVDFPEVDPDFTAPVRAASLNYSPNGLGENGFSSQDNLNTGVHLTDNKYHTFLLTWTPGNMTATIDGKVVATFTGSAVPSQAMRLSMQAEGWINQGAVPTASTDVVEVPWVYINTHN